MDIRQTMIGIYRTARALARPAGGALALAALAACGGDGDSTPERAGEAESAVLSGGTFEGSDGNLVVNGTNATDWVNAPNRFAGVDRASGGTDNAFGQGTKEDSSAVTIVAGSIPPNKNDLTRFYVGSEVRNGDNFLYLAWERVSNIGSANLDFEINQNPTPGFTGSSTGSVNLVRTSGDILVTYDFSGSGAPVLGLDYWLVSATDPVIPGFATNTCLASNGFPCWGDHQTLSAANAEGAVNTTTVQDTISVAGAPAPNPPGSLTVGLFGEAAINLSRAGVFQTGKCKDFGSAFVKSRSSSSFTAEIKDFIAPVVPLGISNCTVALTKTVDKPTASPGEVLTYTLTYSNPNQTSLSNVVVSDPLPANTTFVSVASAPAITCTAPAVGATGTVSCSTPTLAAGASGTVTLAVKLASSFPAGNTTVTNVATLSSDQTPSVTAQASTVVTAAPALAISKAVDKTTASPGDQLTYQLTYSNNGTASASNVVVSDTLPARTTFVAVSSSPSLACSAPAAGATGTVSCPIPTLAAGATGTVSITVKLDSVFPNGSTAVTNTGSINDTPSNPVTTTVDAAPVLAVIKAVDRATASPGDVLVYTLSYTNDGNAAATNAIVSDALPAKTTFVGVTSSPALVCTAPAVGANGTVSCTIPTLAAGGSGSVTITVKLDSVFPSGSTVVTNVGAIDGKPSNPVTTTVGAAPALAITKSVDKATAAPGQQIVYTLSYANSGNADASNVTISDALPAKTTFVSIASSPALACAAPAVGANGTVSCAIPTLAAGATGTITIVVALDSVFPSGTTHVVNTAVINGTTSNPVTTDVDAAPALAITKEVDKDTASPGDQLVYTLSYENHGNADASNVTISDALPERTTFVSIASTPSLSCTTPAVGDNGTVSCAIPTLAAGATGTITITVKLDAVFPSGTTEVTNTAVVNDTPSNPVTTTVDAAAVLSLSKTAVVAPTTASFVNQAAATSAEGASANAGATSNNVTTGSTITYTLTLVNGGAANATNVVISDPLPAGLVFVSVAPVTPMACTAPAVGANGTVSCTIPTLAAGATAKLVLTAKTQ